MFGLAVLVYNAYYCRGYKGYKLDMSRRIKGARPQRVLLLPGDGIGPEIVAQGERVLLALRDRHGLALEIRHGAIGGAAVEAAGRPLPPATLESARECDAVLLGAVGGPRWEGLQRELRPERGLLDLRAALGLYANLRPARLYPELAAASSLRPEVVSGLDLLIVRELTGGLYFGEPRGLRTLDTGERQGYNTLRYSEREVERIARAAFAAAAGRSGRLCSVDKANALESLDLWRQVVSAVAADYPGVALRHLYVDNAAMQLVKAPRQFDVLLTENLFGDILSDLAAMLTGSIGMLPSASLNGEGRGMYEPVHGSAPDIAGEDRANPLACILSVAMMLRHSLRGEALAQRVEEAVRACLRDGLRTPDIHSPGMREVGTRAMGEAVIARL